MSSACSFSRSVIETNNNEDNYSEAVDGDDVFPERIALKLFKQIESIPLVA